MSVAETIRAKLTKALSPDLLEIEDQSAQHAGHAAAKGLPAGETHFAVAVVSAKFGGLNRVARQRLVYGILAEELRHPVHALALTTLTSDEASKK